MIRFKFDLPDCEAQNLVFILQHAIEDAKIKSMLTGKEYSDAEREWFAKNAKYVEKESLQVILAGQSRVESNEDIK